MSTETDAASALASAASAAASAQSAAESLVEAVDTFTAKAAAAAVEGTAVATTRASESAVSAAEAAASAALAAAIEGLDDVAGAMALTDADGRSAFRVQQDARLNERLSRPESLLAAGDSMTVGTGSSPQESYVVQLAADLDASYTISARGGQTSTEVAIRVGALRPRVTFPGNSLPAGNAPVAVTVDVLGGVIRSIPHDFEGEMLLDPTLANPRGVLEHDAAGNWTFTRTGNSPSARDVPAASEFLCTEVEENRSDVFLLWVGANNLAEVPDLDVAVRDVDLIVRYLREWGNDRFLILGLSRKPNEANAAAKIAYDALMRTRYLGRFVDTQAIMVTSGMALAGLTPDFDDRDFIAAGQVPRALINYPTDNTHFNTAGYTVLRRAVDNMLRSHGWIAGTIPVLPLTTAPVVTVGAVTGSTIALSWTAVTGAVGYGVEYRALGSTLWRFVDGTTSTSTTINPSGEPLDPGTSYEFRVTAHNNAGSGAASAAVTGTTEVSVTETLLASDTFSGADNTTMNGAVMDKALGGSLATPTWASNNNNAERVSQRLSWSGSSHVYLDTAGTNAKVKARLVTGTNLSGEWYGIELRYVDTNNYYQLRVTANTRQLSIRKRVAGVDTVIGSLSGVNSALDGVLLEFSVLGSTLTSKANGVTIHTITDTALTAGTRHGVASQEPGVVMDDVRIYSIS